MAFKEQIKQLRKKNNLLQKELAIKLGISKPTVSCWEQGIRFPNSTQRKKLCKIFNISEAELFGGQALAATKDINPDILEALQDPIAVKALLITHKNSQDIKNAIRLLRKIGPELFLKK